MSLVYKHERKLFAIAVVIAAVLWLALIGVTLGVALLYLAIGFVVYLFVQSAFISGLKGNGVKVTAAQFPDLYQSLRECCRKVGVERPPDMYLLRTDFFNALATKFLGRNFIVLYSDVVDALADEPGAIDFYIGHELGHIHRKHLRWMAFLFPAMLLPVLGTAYRRSQEYTCDRYGTVCCGGEREIRAALAAMAAGNTRWKTLDTAHYLAQIPDTRGFWMSFHELTNDYPWLTKRMASALALARNQDVAHPRRSFFAGVLSLFVPRLGLGGAGPLGLLLTIAAIGVLAAIAIPAYQDYTIRAQVTLALADARAVQARVEDYVVSNDRWPQSLTELGYPADSLPAAGGAYGIGLYDDGTVGIVLGTDADGEPRYLVLEPAFEDERLIWLCYGQNAIDAHLPSACRQ